MLVNRLGALALRIVDRVAEATEPFAARTASHPEALVALLGFAEGKRLDVLRDALDLSQPGTTHLIAALEAEGLAERQRDPSDGRARILLLTPAGRRLARRIVRARQQAIERVLEPCSAVERDALLRLVDALLERGTPPGARAARRTCRACAPDLCDHPATCPVTRGAAR